MLGTRLEDGDLVFSQPGSEPLLPDAISQAWTKLARRTGLEGIRLHDARHSHTSLMLKQGIHPKIVQERLGHASIQTTLDIYIHPQDFKRLLPPDLMRPSTEDRTLWPRKELVSYRLAILKMACGVAE